MLFILSDQELVRTYALAIKLRLEKEFIIILEQELQRRNLKKAINQKQE